MEMREFEGTGIRASVVGLGCNNFGIYQNATQAVAVVRKALDVGINFLDMAGEHGSGLRGKPGRRGAGAAPQRGSHRHEIRASRIART